MAESKELEKKLEEMNDRMASMKTKSMTDSIKSLGDVNILVARVDGTSVDEMKALADSAKSQMNDGVVVLGANTDDKITFVAMAMKGAVAKGVHCGNIIKELTAACDGRGGGKPDMAQGGGKDASKIDAALAMAEGIVAAQTGKE